MLSNFVTCVWDAGALNKTKYQVAVAPGVARTWNDTGKKKDACALSPLRLSLGIDHPVAIGSLWALYSI